jgi:glycosidase
MDAYFEFDVAAAARGAADVGLANQYVQAVQAASNQLPFQRWAPFLTNHDQNRVMSELDDDPDKARLAAIALLTLPGLPFIYYGEEVGQLGLKPDEDIRTPMQWSAEPAAGFSTGDPWRAPQPDYPTKNVAAQEEDPFSLLNTYRALVQLHTSTPALATGEFVPFTSDNSAVAAFLRVSGESVALVLINFDRADAVDVRLSLADGPLPEGDYVLTPIFGTPEVGPAPLTVGAGGAVQDYIVIQNIPPRTGYIFSLAR